MVDRIKTDEKLKDYKNKGRLTDSHTHDQKSYSHTSQDTFGHSYEGRDAAGKVEAVEHATEFLLPDKGKNE